MLVPSRGGVTTILMFSAPQSVSAKSRPSDNVLPTVELSTVFDFFCIIRSRKSPPCCTVSYNAAAPNKTLSSVVVNEPKNTSSEWF